MHIWIDVWFLRRWCSRHCTACGGWGMCWEGCWRRGSLCASPQLSCKRSQSAQSVRVLASQLCEPARSLSSMTSAEAVLTAECSRCI